MYKRVEESIDVINMVRDFNYLKILVHFLFRKEHINTAQIVGFELWHKEKQIKEKIKGKIEGMIEKASWIESIDKEKNRTLYDNIFEFERCLTAVMAIKSSSKKLPSKIYPDELTQKT